MSHWYGIDKLGRPFPCHHVPKKDGKGLKAVTITEARELKLMPSVTTVIDKILAKPNLIQWKIRQAILAAVTLPRRIDETLDEHVKRIEIDMDEEGRAARDFGGDIHTGIEAILQGKKPNLDIEPYVAGMRDWINEHVEEVHATEETVYHPSGFAGRLDLRCRLKIVGDAIVDFKTQKFESVPRFYPEYGMQLAAYEKAAREASESAIVSVVINSQMPGPVHSMLWDSRDKYYEMFSHLLNIWKFLNNYEPGH
jgi:hypothetical protein